MVMARVVVKKADRKNDIRESGLESGISSEGRRSECGTHLRKKWGRRRRAGIIMKAGKVMRLKRPKTKRKAKRPDEKIEDRCCPHVSNCWCRQIIKASYLILNDTLYQNQAPCHKQSLHCIRKCMRLIGPGDVGRCYQHYRLTSSSR